MLVAAYGLALAAVVFGFFRPTWAFVLLFVLAAFTRELGTGVVTRRITPFDLALAGLSLQWAWRWWRAGKLRAVWSRVLLFAPVLALVLLALIQIPWVQRWDVTLVTALLYLELVIAAALTLATAQTQGAAGIYRMMILVMTAVAVICLYEFSALQLGFPTLWPETFRILGPFKNPNQTGSYLAMGLPLVLGSLANPRVAKLPGWLSLAALCIQGLALLLTYSRTSILAAVGAILLFTVLMVVRHLRVRSGPFPWQVFVAPLLLGALVVGVLATSAGVREVVIWKVQGLLRATQGFSAAVVGAALETWKTRPWSGVGLGNFPYANVRHDASLGYEVHGTYLAILAEAGLAGAACLAAFLWMVGRRLAAGVWSGKSPAGSLVVGATAALSALLASGVWDTFLRKRHFWMLVGLALALAAEELVDRAGVRLRRPAGDLRVREEPDLEAALREVEQAQWQSANPYLLPAWLRTWHRHFGQHLSIAFLLVYRGEQLVGYAPFGYEDGWTCRRYQFLGQGLANYLEPAACQGEEEAVTSVLADWFRVLPLPASVIFHDLSSDSVTASALQRAVGTRRIDRYRLYDCPYMRLSADWEEVLNRHQSPKDRSEFRRVDRHWAALGALEFRMWASPDEAAELVQLLPALRAVHRQRFSGVWNELLQERFWRMLAELIPATLGRGLEFATLRVQGRVAAFSANMPMGDRHVGYLIAMDPAFRSLGPGQLLLRRMFQALGARGVRLFDFSKGSSAYKRNWADGITYNETLIWWIRPGLGAWVQRLCRRGGIGLRLWLRRRHVTSWLRTLPRRLLLWRKARECQVTHMESADMAQGSYSPELFSTMQPLPEHVQDAVIRLVSRSHALWEVFCEGRARRLFLRADGAGGYSIRW